MPSVPATGWAFSSCGIQCSAMARRSGYRLSIHVLSLRIRITKRNIKSMALRALYITAHDDCLSTHAKSPRLRTLDQQPSNTTASHLFRCNQPDNLDAEPRLQNLGAVR